MAADNGDHRGKPLQHNIRLRQIALMRFHPLQHMGYANAAALGFNQIKDNNQQQAATTQQSDTGSFAEVLEVVGVGNRQ